MAPGGTLLAFCEARKFRGTDASPTDMVLKRSTDGGRTWGPLQVVIPGTGEEAIMNPCPVVDGDSVLLFCIKAHRTGHNHHRYFLLSSEDEGRTWSHRESPDSSLIAQDDTFISGPGVGIKMRSGRIVIPGYTNEMADETTRAASWSRVTYSDDHGLTWRLGQAVDFPWSNESQVVELSNGALLLNWRVQKKEGHPGCRGTALSHDGGETWSAPQLVSALPEAPCQAGFVSLDTSQRGALVFSNPDPAGGGRSRMTVRLSPDDGATWPHARVIHDGPAAYSCPVDLGDGSIGLLYEGGETRYGGIRFARLTLGQGL